MTTIKWLKLRRDYFEKKKFKVSHLLGKPVKAQFNYLILKCEMSKKKKNNQSFK